MRDLDTRVDVLHHVLVGSIEWRECRFCVECHGHTHWQAGRRTASASDRADKVSTVIPSQTA